MNPYDKRHHKMKPRLLSILLLAAAVIGCADKSSIIQDNIENAKAQMAFLIESAEAAK